VVAFSVIQIGGLLFVSAVGLHHIGEVDLLAGAGEGWFASARGVATSVALVFFAFIGFDEVTTLSEETQNPTHTTPRALLGALAISSLLYVLVSVTAVSVLGPDELSRSEQPLREVVATAVGDGAGAVMAVLAMITTANTVLLVITAATRMLFAMARQGDLPRTLGHLDRRGTPRRATVAVAAVSACFVLVGRFELIASATDVAVYATFLFVNFIVIALRVRRPDMVRPFRVPISIGRVPVVPVVATVVTIWMVALLEFRAIAVTGGIMTLGLVMSLARGSRPKTFG
jgi:APA family basic amino acid/polyamine antiporter